MKNLAVAVIATLYFLAGTSRVLAEPGKTLIELTNDQPVAALAKSWKKLKAGEFEFVIDTSAELMGGKALTTGAVKESLEKKLSTTLGLSVTPIGPDTVVIRFTGQDKEFLSQLAQVKIRAQSSDVADGSGSDGGIRARPPNIVLADGEIRGFVLKVKKDHVVFRVIESKSTEFKVGDSLDMQFNKELPIKKNLDLYFIPEKAENGFWQAKEGTLSR